MRCPVCGFAAPCPKQCQTPPEHAPVKMDNIKQVWRYFDERRWCYVYTKAECGPWSDEAESVRVRVLNSMDNIILEVEVLR